jgi:hypothetical protein
MRQPQVRGMIDATLKVSANRMAVHEHLLASGHIEGNEFGDQMSQKSVSSAMYRGTRR